MEEEPSTPLRRNSVPSSVLIPTDFEVIPKVKPRNSPSTPNGNGHHYRHLPPPSPPSSSSPSAVADFELVSFKSSPTYTSLKDLLPSSPSLLSPTPVCAVAGASSTTTATSTASGGASTLFGYEISIRNRLVKQAAWAYLQPMAPSPSASGRRLWSYFSGDFIRPILSSIKRALVDCAARACNWLADALWLLLCR